MIKFSKTIEAVLNDFSQGAYSNQEPYPEGRILPITHVFDETLSVKKNKELVESHNANLKSEKAAYREHSAELNAILRKDCIAGVVYSCSLTEEQAELVVQHSFHEHSSYFDAIQTLTELGDIAKSVIDASAEKRVDTQNRSVQGVLQNYSNGVYTNNDPFPKERTLPLTHVFDEDLSVAENKRLIEDFNNKVKQTKQAYRDKSDALNQILTKDCEDALICEYGLSEEQAEIVNAYAYREYHSSVFDYIQNLHDLGSIAQKLVETTR